MLNRRDAMVGLGHMTLGSLALPTLLRAEAAQASDRVPVGIPGAGKAKHGILIFLWGGPPQMDMFDPKPDAPDGIRTLFKPLNTNVSGIQLTEMMPLTAQQADKFSIIRSVTHGSDAHEVGCYYMMTGKWDTSMVVPRNNRRRTHAPGLGGVMSCLSPSANVPSSFTLPRPVMHDGTRYAGTHAGWLGPQYDPVELPEVPLVNGNPVLNFSQAAGVDVDRLVKRQGLLHAVETMDRTLQNGPVTKGTDIYRERAFSLLSSGATKEAFDLSRESDKMRDRYGRNHYGESFLLARRLIEAGTRFVTLNWMFFRPDGNPLNPWDNHGGTGALGGVSGYEMLKRDYCIPPLDRAYSALLEDLHARGMLDETAIVAMGEFGRTPKINSMMGRDHWGACQSVLVAGGGFKGGTVYGASDAHAAYPAENPVSPPDLLASLYAAFGFAPETTVLDVENRPQPITDGRPIPALF
jgi:hypothetical protein